MIESLYKLIYGKYKFPFKPIFYKPKFHPKITKPCYLHTYKIMACFSSYTFYYLFHVYLMFMAIKKNKNKLSQDLVTGLR